MDVSFFEAMNRLQGLPSMGLFLLSILKQQVFNKHQQTYQYPQDRSILPVQINLSTAISYIIIIKSP